MFSNILITLNIFKYIKKDEQKSTIQSLIKSFKNDKLLLSVFFIELSKMDLKT